jgi:hypothetical protein
MIVQTTSQDWPEMLEVFTDSLLTVKQFSAED